MFSARSRFTSNATKPNKRPVNARTGYKPVLSSKFFQSCDAGRHEGYAFTCSQAQGAK